MLLAVPIAVAVLAYAATVTFGFVWDDRHLIVDNTVVRQPSLIPVLAWQFWQEGERTDLYRPLVSLSYFLEFRAWGMSPAGYHATTVAAHAAASVAVAWTGRWLLGTVFAGAVAGMIFALHPIHTESVAFISGRPDVLVALFGLAALAAHIRRRGAVPVAGPVLLGCALLCKETAFALPGVLVAYELTVGSSARLRDRPGSAIPGGSFQDSSGSARLRLRLALLALPGLLGLWPYGVVTLAALGLRSLVLGSAMGASTDATPFAARVAMTASATAEYLRLLVVPWPPAPHRFPDTASALTGVLLVVTLVLVAVLAWRRSRSGVFLCCWFALTLLPATPLVPGRTPQVAERFLYVPSVAFAWLGGWAVAAARARLASRGPGLRRGGAVTAIAVGLGALALTAIRAEDWRDERRLFTRMAQSEPRSALAQLNLGYVSDRAGDLDRADGEFRTALSLRPDWAPALLGLALVESRRGEHDAAIAHAERARALDGRGEFVHAQLGAIYGIAGRFEDAATSSREAIRRNPRRLPPYLNLAFALADTGRLDEAREALSEAERVAAGQISPEAGALRMLAHLRVRLGASGPMPIAREASR